MERSEFNELRASVPIASHLKRYERRRLLTRVERALSLPGDIAECGVCAGGTAGLMIELCKRHGVNKIVHLFDAFDVFPDVRTSEEVTLQQGSKYNTKNAKTGSAEEVGESLRKRGLTNFEIHKGLFSETLPKFHKQLCLIHGDADLYQSTLEISEFAKRLLVKGGYYIVHDWKEIRWAGVTKAINDTINFDYYNVTEYGHQLILQRKE